MPVAERLLDHPVSHQARLDSEDFATDGLAVRFVHIDEALGELYRVELEVVVVDGDAPAVTDLIGTSAQLLLENAAGEATRRVPGVVIEATKRHDVTENETRPVLRLTLAPELWRLTLFRTQEVFLDMTIPEIIEAKIERLQLGSYARFALSGDYPKRELVVQYQESDLDFICRLCEHLGVTFYFAAPDDDDVRETVVFCDDTSAWSRLDVAVPYVAEGQAHGVHSLATTARAVPRLFMVNDYNYRTPDVDLARYEPVADGMTGGVVEYGSHHKTPDEGSALARVRAEEAQSAYLTHLAEASVAGLGAGHVFTLDDHPELEGAPLLVVAHETTMQIPLFGSGGGESERAYTSSLRLADATKPYRPARTTPRPKIFGILSAIVQPGPSGETGGPPRLDDDGRYLVRFHFDTAPLDHRPASQWVRMAQPYVTVGDNGMHFPLQRGTEVLIAFIDGNPDRPIIVGAVPNAVNPATVTSRESQINRIKTTDGLVIQFGKG